MLVHYVYVHTLIILVFLVIITVFFKSVIFSQIFLLVILLQFFVSVINWQIHTMVINWQIHTIVIITLVISFRIIFSPIIFLHYFFLKDNHLNAWNINRFFLLLQIETDFSQMAALWAYWDYKAWAPQLGFNQRHIP